MCHVASFQKKIRYDLGNGDRIAFWSDIWCGNKPVKDLFLAVHLMAENYLARAVDYIDTSSIGGIWYPSLRRDAHDWDMTGRFLKFALCWKD